MSSLDALVQIIANSVKDMQSKCAERGATYPTLDVPASPETDKLQAELAGQAAPAIAAAFQLIATLQLSKPYLLGMGFLSVYPAALALAEAALVPDILREAGPNGAHIKDIAAVRNVDPNKLGRAIRALATRHVFEEVAPDVFRNNRVSAALCIGKPVKEMAEKPEDRWDGTSGIAAFASLAGDVIPRATSALVENTLDPATAFSEEPNASAFARAHNTTLSTYEYIDQPGNELLRKKFGLSMGSHADDFQASGGFDWAAVPAGSKVVDVGGGVGSYAVVLAKEHPHLKYIVQDRPGTVQEGELLLKEKNPELLEHGTVQLQAHDFFEEQPVTDASVFVARYITHNWSDKYARKVLQRLRAAARPDTTLVVIDDIQDYLCRGGAGAVAGVPGVAKPVAPEPLLPYVETATSHLYSMDMAMLIVNNCAERTIGHFVELFESAGWRLERVHRFSPPTPPQLICKPM